jgi:hypothetical protein
MATPIRRHGPIGLVTKRSVTLDNPPVVLNRPTASQFRRFLAARDPRLHGVKTHDGQGFVQKPGFSIRSITNFPSGTRKTASAAFIKNPASSTSQGSTTQETRWKYDNPHMANGSASYLKGVRSGFAVDLFGSANQARKDGRLGLAIGRGLGAVVCAPISVGSMAVGTAGAVVAGVAHTAVKITGAVVGFVPWLFAKIPSKIWPGGRLDSFVKGCECGMKGNYGPNFSQSVKMGGAIGSGLVNASAGLLMVPAFTGASALASSHKYPHTAWGQVGRAALSGWLVAAKPSWPFR